MGSRGVRGNDRVFDGWEGSSIESDKSGALVLNVDGKVYESCTSVQQQIRSTGLAVWKHKSGFTDSKACFDKRLLHAMRGANCIFKLPDFHTANQGENTKHKSLRRLHNRTADDGDDCAFRALETIVAQGHWGAYRMAYGAMSAAMLTPKPHAQNYLNYLRRYMKWPSAPVIGMHVRRGDACKCTMTSCKTLDEGRLGTCFPLIDYVKQARVMKKK